MKFYLSFIWTYY